MAAYITKASAARMWSPARTVVAAAPTSVRSYSTKLARFASVHSIRSSTARNGHAYRSLSSSARRFEEKLVSGTLQSPSELARKLSEAALPLIPRPDVKKVLVVGSGGLSIGQAGEFDYSGENFSFLTTTFTIFIPFFLSLSLLLLPFLCVMNKMFEQSLRSF